MAKLTAKQVAVVLTISNTMKEKSDELGNLFEKLVAATAARCKTEADVIELDSRVAAKQHEAVFGTLTKDELKLAKKGELDKDGFTKAGKLKGLIAVQGQHTRNAWNLIIRCYSKNVTLLNEKGKAKGWSALESELSSSGSSGSSKSSSKASKKGKKIDASAAEAMKDACLAELTKVANDIKKYKGAFEGLENGIICIMEELFGYDFS